MATKLWRGQPGGRKSFRPFEPIQGKAKATLVAAEFFDTPASSGNSVAPGAGTLTLTGYAPTVAQPQTAAPGAGSLTITGYAPGVAQPQTSAPGVGSVAITGYAPTVAQPSGVAPGVGGVAITGYAPGIGQPQTALPAVGALTIAGYAPTVTQGQDQGQAAVPDGDGGGSAIRARLLREFKDDEERRKDRAALADLSQIERTALRAVAEQIAHAPLVTVESVEARITAALADLGQPATADHLDWTLYFLRVQADAARVAGQALARAMRRDDEEAALMLLLM